MKRREFIRYLAEHECALSHETGKYSIFKNSANGQEVPVTRHNEIAEFTVKKICRSLGIEPPH